MSDVRDTIARAIADEPPPSCKRPGHDPPWLSLRTRRAARNHQARPANHRSDGRARAETHRASPLSRFATTRSSATTLRFRRPTCILAPADYERKQTLVNAERFTSGELKEYERKVLSAEERILEIERRLYGEIREAIAREANRLRRTAAADRAARRAGEFCAYRRIDETTLGLNSRRSRSAEPKRIPRIEPTDRVAGNDATTERGLLMIAGGRHPVIEKLLEERGERFVPNDLYLDDESQFLLIITGPNMGGKSTYLRQAALIAILAQMGSFVPAAQARLPLARPHFYAHRRVRQPGARAVHVPGRNERGRRHPQHRHQRQPGAARRSRPWHGHLRRTLDRLGRSRIAARGRAAQNAFCYALPRAHRARTVACRA